MNNQYEILNKKLWNSNIYEHGSCTVRIDYSNYGTPLREPVALINLFFVFMYHQGICS
jgi:hypothetical protein